MKRIVLIVDADQAGQRLDRFLAAAHPEMSRSEVQDDVRAGRVTVADTVTTQPSRRLRENEEIAWDPADRAPLVPRPASFDILYEDEQLVVIDKPIGLVVHPGAGTEEPTLVEGLLCDRRLPESDDPSRPGIVHRLDKETSGVIVVAKTAAALAHLQAQFAARSVRKSYVAVVDGILAEEEATIDAPIGRDPANPRKMSVQARGKPAQTDIRILARLGDSTLLLAHPRTGRTHQIRVHLAYIEHSVVGDSPYGRTSRRDRAGQHTSSQGDPCSAGAGGQSLLRKEQAEGAVYGNAAADRLYLHAWRLTVEHPGTAEPMTFEAPLPTEFPRYPYDEIP